MRAQSGRLPCVLRASACRKLDQATSRAFRIFRARRSVGRIRKILTNPRIRQPCGWSSGSVVNRARFLRIARESRIARRQLRGPTFLTLITANDSSILAHIAHQTAAAKWPQIADPYPLNGSGKKLFWADGRSVAIAPGPSGVADHSSSTFRAIIAAKDAPISPHS